jgi:peptide-methionine (S)-S-oxide reductase
VVRTRVGYSGGTKKAPTYYSLGDHSETVQIDFDPTQITYEKLLEIFWAAHDPTARSWSRQYKAAVFFHNEVQQRLAIETRDREAARKKTRVFTEILPYNGFTLAEGYHQKYYLRQNPDLMKEFTAMYPKESEFIDSTAAARLNGYLAGYGAFENLLTDAGGLGLSPEESQKLLARVHKLQR